MAGGAWRGHHLDNATPFIYEEELLASAARTANGTSLIKGLAPFNRALIELKVTAAATEVGDTLNVYIQRALPDLVLDNHGVYVSGSFQDMVSFTQVLGNGGAKTYVADIHADTTRAYSATINDAALAAGSVDNMAWGNVWRIKWVIVDANANANQSFTFGIKATLGSN